MMGVSEEGSKAVGSIVDSLKSQPLSLALVIMNLALLAIFYVILDRTNKTREREFNALHAEQKEVRELLVKCATGLNMPAPRSDLGGISVKG